MDLLDIPEEIASELAGAAGKAIEFMSTEMHKLASLLEGLSARLDALEHHGESPPAT